MEEKIIESSDIPPLFLKSTEHLIKLKLSKITEPAWIVCPICKNEVSGLVGDVCWNCRNETLRKNELIKYLKTKLNSENIEQYQFKNFTRNQGNNEAIYTAQMFNPCLDNIYFYGWNGSGKTSLAKAIICKNVIQKIERIRVN